MSTHKSLFSGKRGNEVRALKESNSITLIGGRASGPPQPTTTPLLLEVEDKEEEEEAEEEIDGIDGIEELELDDAIEIPPPPSPEVYGFGDKRADELGVRGGGLPVLRLKLFAGGIDKFGL